MRFNWRRLPHPTYGNYGGAKQTGDQTVYPIDWMDEAFRRHDLALKKANGKYWAREEADCNLVLDLKEGDPSKLAKPIYGRLYRLGTFIVFMIVCAR